MVIDRSLRDDLATIRMAAVDAVLPVQLFTRRLAVVAGELVLDGQPLYACKYFMARKHWQIVKREGSRVEPGNAETLPVDKAPASVVSLAVRAARLIGDGLYGVDLKVLDGKAVVIV